MINLTIMHFSILYHQEEICWMKKLIDKVIMMLMLMALLTKP